MNQFKYFVFIFLFCFLIKQESNNVCVFISLTLVTLYFSIKYLLLKNKFNNITKVMYKAMKDQREKFIYSLSHDLRIPVLAQLRMLELINLEKFGKLSAPQSEMLNQTEQSSRCILNLISLMINTYKIENHSSKLIYQRFNLYELVSSCFNELFTDAQEKNLTYEYICEDKNLCINADRDEIKKVLINLIQASILYSNYGGKISIQVKVRGNKLRLSVFCDGENTYSINTNMDSQYSSIGESIRMHFCKKIIEVHKGQIINNPTSKKSFEFELPRMAV